MSGESNFGHAAQHIRNLAAKLRQAEGPDLALNNDLWLLFGSGPTEHPFPDYKLVPMDPCNISMGRTMKEAMEQCPDDVGGISRSWNVPDLTGDVQRALDLVPKSTTFSVGGGGEDEPWAQLHDRLPVKAANIAIAVCLAHCEMVADALEAMNAYTAKGPDS